MFMSNTQTPTTRKKIFKITAGSASEFEMHAADCKHTGRNMLQTFHTMRTSSNPKDVRKAAEWLAAQFIDPQLQEQGFTASDVRVMDCSITEMGVTS